MDRNVMESNTQYSVRAFQQHFVHTEKQRQPVENSIRETDSAERISEMRIALNGAARRNPARDEEISWMQDVRRRMRRFNLQIISVALIAC